MMKYTHVRHLITIYTKINCACSMLVDLVDGYLL